MLEEMEQRVLGRCLVERRGVPGVDHHDPQEDRDDWVHERSQVAKAGRAQDRPEDRAGEPQGQQERRLVGEDRVLDHVAEDEVVAQARPSGPTVAIASRRSPPAKLSWRAVEGGCPSRARCVVRR